MNVRIRNKIHKRAKQKLDLARKPRDKRTYLEMIDEEPNILSSLEESHPAFPSL